MALYPHLKITGDLGLSVAVAVDELMADYGDGYDASVLTGDERGLLSWALKFGTLPGAAQDSPVNDQAQADWLWDFFLARKAAGNQSFTVRDPRSGNIRLAKFAESRLAYEMLLCKLWSTGLNLQQRREPLGNILERAAYWHEADWLNLGDGEAVAEWPGAKESATLRQHLAALQPNFNLYGWSSSSSGALAPTLAFGGGRRLSLSGYGAAGAVTAFLTGAAMGYDQCFFELGSGAVNTGLLLYTESGNKLVAAAYRSGVGHYAVKTGFAAGAPHLYTVRASATHLKLWIDGIPAAITPTDAHLAGWANLTVGSAGGGAAPLTGDIQTLAIFPEDMSDAEIGLLNTRLLAGARI